MGNGERAAWETGRELGCVTGEREQPEVMRREKR